MLYNSKNIFEKCLILLLVKSNFLQNILNFSLHKDFNFLIGLLIILDIQNLRILFFQNYLNENFIIILDNYFEHFFLPYLSDDITDYFIEGNKNIIEGFIDNGYYNSIYIFIITLFELFKIENFNILLWKKSLNIKKLLVKLFKIIDFFDYNIMILFLIIILISLKNENFLFLFSNKNKYTELIIKFLNYNDYIINLLALKILYMISKNQKKIVIEFLQKTNSLKQFYDLLKNFKYLPINEINFIKSTLNEKILKDKKLEFVDKNLKKNRF